MSDCLIRRMKEEDLPQIVEIEQENFSIPWSEQSFRDMLCRREMIYLTAVCRGTGEIIGYAGGSAAGEEGDVINIAVRGSEKQKGTGTALLARLLEEMRSAGVREFFLEVREHNVPALRLYTASGFVPVGRRKGYYDRPREDALIMKKM